VSEDELPVASGVRDTDQSPTKIQPKFHLKHSACFLFMFWRRGVGAAGSLLSLPVKQHSFVFLYFLVHLILVRVNSQRIKSPTKVQPQFHLSLSLGITLHFRRKE
jgi:hypothetical protein